MRVASIGLVVLLACAAAPDLEDRSLVGMSQDQLRAELGEPASVDSMTKTVEHIFGPVETLWSEMEMGDTLTTWTYLAPAGRKELYFVGESDEVAGEFYWYADESKNPVF